MVDLLQPLASRGTGLCHLPHVQGSGPSPSNWGFRGQTNDPLHPLHLFLHHSAQVHLSEEPSLAFLARAGPPDAPGVLLAVSGPLVLHDLLLCTPCSPAWEVPVRTTPPRPITDQTGGLRGTEELPQGLRASGQQSQDLSPPPCPPSKAFHLSHVKLFPATSRFLKCPRRKRVSLK